MGSPPLGLLEFHSRQLHLQSDWDGDVEIFVGTSPSFERISFLAWADSPARSCEWSLPFGRWDVGLREPIFSAVFETPLLLEPDAKAILEQEIASAPVVGEVIRALQELVFVEGSEQAL